MLQFIAPSVPNPVEGTFDAGGLLVNIINIALVWAGAIALVFIIIGGFRFIFSMGNAEGVEGARKTVLYAVLGLILIFLAYLIVAYLLGDVLNVKPAYRLGT